MDIKYSVFLNVFGILSEHNLIMQNHIPRVVGDLCKYFFLLTSRTNI